MGLRYGLLAVLTLVLASALVWDRLHPPETNRLLPRDLPSREDLAVVVLGGKPEPLPPPPPCPAPLPGGGAPAEPAAAAREGTYTVESGDSLSQIALRTMGSSRRAADLAKYNGIPLDAPLKVGQEVRIPPASPAASSPAPGTGTEARAPLPAPAPAPAKEGARSHRVGRGDTLYSLARKYYGDGKRFRDLAQANGLDPEEPLKVGTELRVP